MADQDPDAGKLVLLGGFRKRKPPSPDEVRSAMTGVPVSSDMSGVRALLGEVGELSQEEKEQLVADVRLIERNPALVQRSNKAVEALMGYLAFDNPGFRQNKEVLERYRKTVHVPLDELCTLIEAARRLQDAKDPRVRAEPDYYWALFQEFGLRMQRILRCPTID